MPIPQSIQGSVNKQANLALRGQSPREPTNVRQRHMWSTYCFNSVTNTGQITGGLLSARDYPVFTALQDSNGQGMPQGLSLSLCETNWASPSRVSDNQNFSIHEIGVSILPLRQDVVALGTTVMTQGPVNPEDADLILTQGVLKLNYLTTTNVIGHLGAFPCPALPSLVAPVLNPYDGNQNVAQTGGGFAEGGIAAPWDARQAKYAVNAGNVSAAPALRRKYRIPTLLGSGETFNFSFTFTRNVQLRTVARGGTGGFMLRLDLWTVESFFENI